MEAIFKIIEELTGRYTEFLKDICTFETPSRDKPAMDKMSDYIEEFSKERGFSVKRTPMKDCGDFLTIDINEGKEKGNMFLAHMDTVHQKGVFGYPPVTTDGERMTGPGTIDCKGGIAIALLVMDALKKTGYNKHTRLMLTSDEEISNTLGGEAEQKFIRESVKGFKAALNCETTDPGEVTVSRKGILLKEIIIKGIGGHSGMAYFTSSSAVLEAAYKITELEKNSREGGITYNCSVINGGSTPNCIPDSCVFTVDIRVVSLNDMKIAEGLVAEIADKSYVKGTKSTVRHVSSRPPMERNAQTDKLFDSLNAISMKYGLGELAAAESGGGSDSAYTKLAGVPSICGLGGEGGLCHTANEYIELKSIPLRAKLLAAFCMEGEA